MKTCSKCKIEKAESNFSKDPSRPDGLYPQCKDCRRIARQAAFDRDPEKHRQYFRERQRRVRATPEGRERSNQLSRDAAHRDRSSWETWGKAAVHAARTRAKKQGVPCNITAEYVRSLWPSDNRCPVLGIELLCGQAACDPQSPSLDKIIPDKGYVIGNVAVISYRANKIKQDASLEELQKITYWLATQMPQLHVT